MRGVATAAGVGERTLYDAFPNKAALFAHTLGVAIVGDEDDVPVARRREVRAALELSNPKTALAHLVTYTAALTRAVPVT